jgi:hypothetical protein
MSVVMMMMVTKRAKEEPREATTLDQLKTEDECLGLQNSNWTS